MTLSVVATVVDGGKYVRLTVEGAVGTLSAVAYPATGRSYPVRTPWTSQDGPNLIPDGTFSGPWTWSASQASGVNNPPDVSGGTAKLTAASAGGTTSIRPVPGEPGNGNTGFPMPLGPSRVLRFTGKVRSSVPATTKVAAWVYTSKAPTGPAIGVGPLNQTAIVATTALAPFSVDVNVTGTPTDDMARGWFHGDSMPIGAILEWDDLAFRWVAQYKIGTDGDVPFGIPVYYVVTDTSAGSVTSNTVQVDSSVPILGDATLPSLSVPVVIRDQLPNTWEARSVWWDVLGSSAPFASLAPLRYRNGDLVLHCASHQDRDAIVGLLSSGVPFTLRTPCGDAVDDVVGLPSTIFEELVNEDDKRGPRWLTISYQAISRDIGPTVGDPTRSYATLVGESATYAVMRSKFARYADVLAGVLA